MGKLVVLKLDGDLEQGIRVTLEIASEGARPDVEIAAELPKAPELVAGLEQWQQHYRNLGALYRIKPKKITYDGSVNQRIEGCRHSAKTLRSHLSQWLESEQFRPIDKRLREELNRGEQIRVLIQTEEQSLQKLPWHLWDFFERYPNAEFAFSSASFERVNREEETENFIQARCKTKIRILAILGHKEGINIEADRQLLENLPQAEIVFLVEPQHQEINDKLWEQPWDILFFAGHSETEGETGRIYINPQDSLTIDELWYALRKAVERGLKLAIFNSCDGLGLARQLDDLHIPQMIVMRELVPDRVAQEFLKYFLMAFVNGKPFYLAVREAREQLQGLESTFPCATWLPVICQNPAEIPLAWEDWLQNQEKKPKYHSTVPIPFSPFKIPNLPVLLLVSMAATAIVLGMRVPLGLLQSWEQKTFDHFIQIRPDEPPDSRLLMIEATEEDIRKYGWPLPDAILAKLLQKLETYQPRVIGLNIYRDLIKEPKSNSLIKQLQQSDRLIATCKNSNANNLGILPPPKISVPRLGFNDVVVDPDDTVRRHLLALTPPPTSPCQTKLAFSLQLALKYLAKEEIKPQYTPKGELQLGKIIFKPLEQGEAGYQNANLWGHQILLNYRSHQSPANMALRVTLTDILTGKLEPQIIKDRIVLIGVTATSIKDDFNTPYNQKLRGLFLQAQMVSQILSAVKDERSLLWVWPWAVEYLWIWSWSFLGSLLAWRCRSLVVLRLASAGMLLSLYGICFGIFTQGGVVPLIPSALAFAIACEGTAASINFISRKNRKLLNFE